VVCVAADGNVPTVVARRRVVLIDSGLPTQPYEHESTAMTEDDADALIARVRRSIARRTTGALQRIVTELQPEHVAVALAIRQPPFPTLPATVAAVWRSYRLRCCADGLLYQLAFCRAARQLELDAQMCRRGEETSRAAEHLGVTPGDIEEFVGRTGRPPGPPWTLEHQRAFAAGIAVLAAHVSRRLRIPAE
jgi:hypothetical protein